VPLVRGDVASLLEDSRAEELHKRLEMAYRSTHFRAAGNGERDSWQYSLRALLTALHEAGLDRCEVLLEHALPRSSLRVDAIVCGRHPRSGRPSFVFVELKQWSKVHAVEGGLVRLSEHDQLRQHPVAQVRGYCHYMHRAVPALAEEKELVSGLAYLHNARRGKVPELLGHTPEDHWGRMYTADDQAEFIKQLNRLLDADRTREENLAARDRPRLHLEA
jgi:hypothetical protein